MWRIIFFLVACAFSLRAIAAEPVVVELSFDSGFNNPGTLADEGAPAWLTKLEQQGGRFLDEPNCWLVEAGAAEGVGRLVLTVNREEMKSSLVMTILFDAEKDADFAVQLLDAQDRVVVVDLFGNVVDVSESAATNTFAIPLSRYPSAEKVVIRRVRGKLTVRGLVLTPVVIEGVPVQEELEAFADRLGDPLSPENPLLKGLQNVAKASKVAINAVKPAESDAAKKKKGPFAAAMLRAPGSAAPPVPSAGLVAQWTFESGDGTDSAGGLLHGRLGGSAKVADGVFGKALLLRKNPTSNRDIQWDCMTLSATPALDLSDNMTVAAWIKFSSIARTWGSQIVWHGDDQFGCDPWTMKIFPNGTLEMRSDRSVTGRPKFTVFENELYLSPKGKPMMNQHVGAYSPRPLAPNTWYFVTGSIGQVSPNKHALRLYVNGELVAEEETDEKVNYPTDKMYTTIGAVDRGGWQNFDGMIDEVRIYNRSLTPAEVTALYQQPRR